MPWWILVWKPLLLTISILLIVSGSAVATAPTNVHVTDSGATTSLYEKFHVISATNDFSLTFANPVYADKIQVGSASHFINFTNAALTANTNPTQVFSLASGTNNCAANLNAIASDHVEINSLTSGCTVDFSYVMPAAYASLSIPQTVIYTFGTSVQLIQQSQYFTSASSFASCAAPCVFQNSANRTLIVKTPTSGVSTLDFYFPANTAGGVSVVGSTTAGGGGSGPPPVYVPPPPSGGGTSTSTSITGATVQIAVVIAIIVVVVALLLGRLSEEKPFREPRSGGSKPRKPEGGSPRPRKPSSGRPRWNR